MQRLTLANVRCFKEIQTVPLKPITLLVGENSTGKSTFLALVRAAAELSESATTPDFNEEPFVLGAWEQLAHYHGGQAKRAKKLTLGASLKLSNRRHRRESSIDEVTVTAEFVERANQPTMSMWVATAGAYSITLRFQEEAPGKVEFSAPSGKIEAEFTVRTTGSRAPLQALYHPLFERVARGSEQPALPSLEKPEIKKPDADVLLDILDRLGLSRTAASVKAGAPIRSEPRRTYDPVRDVPGPEGGHVPMLLKRYSDDPARWPALRDGLQEYAEAAGLFDHILVKRKGAKGSDPFQIHVGFGDLPFNLKDVGYGVSQVLPILVDSLIGEAGTTFLLQQPEVHLHPRAQAELGTFLCKMVRTRRQRFIIETHSDYLIDRVRRSVRGPAGFPVADVLILFFERSGTSVKIHPIELDGEGNLAKAPPAYRDFFLKEHSAILGV